MAITVNSISEGNNDTLNSTTLTFSHTVNAGTDRVLFVCVPMSRLQYVVTIKYGGVDLRCAHGGKYGTAGSGIYFLVNPAVGTDNIVVTYNTSLQYYRAGAMTVDGVDQKQPFLARTATSGTVQNKTISLTTKVDNSMLIECFGDVGTTNTPASGQNYISNGTNRSSAYKMTTTKGLYTLNWTGDISRDFSHSIIEVQPTNIAPIEYFTAVRYIRDWVFGSNLNLGNHWVEFQALEGATNRALSKTPLTGLGANIGTYPVARVTDGVSNNSSLYFDGFHGPQAPLEVDLGDEYNIDTIKVWHYYADGRIYHDNLVEVSQDGINWFTIFDTKVSGEYAETSAGRTHSITYPIVLPIQGARYVRDYINGSTANTGNHWIELQAFEGVTNRSNGILPTSSGTLTRGNVITDGLLYSDANSYSYTTEIGLQYVEVDLGAIYNIDEIKSWHYYPDGRTYYSTKIEVSADGTNWETVFDSAVSGTYAETSAGKTIENIIYQPPVSNPTTGKGFFIF